MEFNTIVPPPYVGGYGVTEKSKMLEYKFVTIDLDRGLLTRKPSRDYHAVIEEHARQGWRLVQIFAPPVYGYGKAVFYELIFERVNE